MSESRKKYKPADRLTRKETADYLGISVSRLSQHRRAGLIDHRKNRVTRAVHYVFSDVERLRQWRESQVTS